MVNVNDTLAERGSRYGEFKSHAQITQDFKDVMRDAPGWKRLTASMKESLEMVAHKIGRILNGDPTHADSWHDIAGYAKLVDDELTGTVPPTPPAPGNRPTPPEFTEPAAPKTKAEFAEAVTPKATPILEPAPIDPAAQVKQVYGRDVTQAEIEAAIAEKADVPVEDAEEVEDAVPEEEAAPKLPETVSKYVAPKAPAPAAPAAPVAPVAPAKKD